MNSFTLIFMLFALSVFARPESRCQSQAELVVRNAHLLNESTTDIDLKRKKFRFQDEEELESYELEIMDREEGYSLDIIYKVTLARHGHGQYKLKSLQMTD